MVLTARIWGPLPSVFAVIGTRSTSLITSRQGRSIAELMARNASAKCLITFPFVSKLKFIYPVFNSVGSQDLKCLCKHSCHDHNPNGNRKCLKEPNCRNNCTGFQSKHHCNCGMTFDQHQTTFQSREEREAEGRQVDPKWMQEQNMVGGMGGLQNDFTGLLEAQDMTDMRNPQAIVDNLGRDKIIMG